MHKYYQVVVARFFALYEYETHTRLCLRLWLILNPDASAPSLWSLLTACRSILVHYLMIYPALNEHHFGTYYITQRTRMEQ